MQNTVPHRSKMNAMLHDDGVAWQRCLQLHSSSTALHNNLISCAVPQTLAAPRCSHTQTSPFVWYLMQGLLCMTYQTKGCGSTLVDASTQQAIPSPRPPPLSVPSTQARSRHAWLCLRCFAMLCYALPCFATPSACLPKTCSCR